MLTKATLQDRMFVALQELTDIAHEYAFEQAGLMQGPDNPPWQVHQAIVRAKYLLQEARETVYQEIKL